MAMQHKQETLVHVISVLNVTRYAMQVKRQHIHLVMDAVERTHHDFTMLYNITNSLYTNLNYQQIVHHICSILANLRDSLYYMRQVTMHAMDYIDAVTTGILLPHVLPVEYSSKYMDTNVSAYSSIASNNDNLSSRSTKIHYNSDTHPHSSPTTSMQCYITTFSPTTML